MSGWDADGALVSVRPVMRMCWLASIHNTAMKVMGKEEYEPVQSLYEQAAMPRKSSQTPKHLLFLCHLEDDSLCQSATLCASALWIAHEATAQHFVERWCCCDVLHVKQRTAALYPRQILPSGTIHFILLYTTDSCSMTLTHAVVCFGMVLRDS